MAQAISHFTGARVLTEIELDALSLSEIVGEERMLSVPSIEMLKAASVNSVGIAHEKSLTDPGMTITAVESQLSTICP